MRQWKTEKINDQMATDERLAVQRTNLCHCGKNMRITTHSGRDGYTW